MPSLSLRIVGLALTFAATACQIPYLVQRGDAAHARGDFARAAANYEAAAEEMPEPHRSAVLEKRNFVRREHARQQLQVASTHATAGAWPEAFQRAWRVREDPNASEAVRAEADRMMHQAWKPLWREVEQLRGVGREVEALQRAEALASVFPPDDPIREPVNALARALAARHRREAASGDVGVRRFRLGLARWFGEASVHAELAQLDRVLEAALGTVPVQVQAAAGCEWLSRSLLAAGRSGAKARAITSSSAADVSLEPAEGGAGLVRRPSLEIRITRCSGEQTERVERRVFQVPRRVQYLESIEEQVAERPPVDPSCEARECARWDQRGVCVEAAPREARCAPPEPVYQTRHVQVARVKTVTATQAHDVHVRKFSFWIAGSLHVLRPDRSPEVRPISAVRTEEDTAFWTPAESKPFRGVSLEVLRQEAERLVAGEVKSAAAEMRTGLLDALIAAGRQADARGDDRAADEYFARAGWLAVHAGETVPGPVATYFLEEHRLDGITLAGALDDRARPPPPSRIVPRDPVVLAERSALEDRRLSATVWNTSEAHGIDLAARSGFDFGFRVATSPLVTAARGHWALLAARGDGFRLNFGAETALIGGQIGGFETGLTIWEGPSDRGNVYFGWGILYRTEESNTKERHRLLGVPLIAAAPIGRWFWVELEVVPNFLKLKEWIDRAPTDPSFFSPLSVRVGFDFFQRFYAKAGVVHHLGATDPFYFDVEWGIRL